MKRIFLCLSLISLLGATGAHPDSTSGTINKPHQIPDSIIISSNRSASNINEAGSSITVITNEQIKKSQTTMLADLLKTVPGVDIVQSGGTGSGSSIFLRGSNSSHTLVLIDGVEMNDPATGSSFDPAHVTLENIQRVEILRGPQSVLYGSDAMAGVIQIFTKAGWDKPTVQLSTEAGSFGTFTESANLRGKHKQLDYSLSATRSDIDGFSSIKSDNPNPENDSYQNSTLSTQLGLQLSPAVNFSFVGHHSDADADIDKNSFNPDDPNYFTNTKLTTLALNSFINPNINLINSKLSLTYSSHKTESFDEFDDIFSDERSAFITDGERLKINLQNKSISTESWNLIIGGEYEKETFSTRSFFENSVWPSADTLEDISAETFSSYYLNEFNPTAGLFLTAGLRYDNHEQFGDHFTYRLTSSYQIILSELRFKASYGTGFKAPSLFQLNHPIWGNPELEAEENKGFDFGFEYTHRLFNLSLTYFEIDYDELIGYDINFQTVNIDKAKTSGIESTIDLSLAPKTTLNINYTYTKATDKADDSQLIRRPEHKGLASLTHLFIDKLETGFDVVYVGKRKDTDFNTFSDITVDSYVISNLNLSYNLNPKIKINGRIINLFDKEYQQVLTYNSSRRAFYGGIKLTF